MILSHHIALRPTDAQRTYFAKAAGCARLVWNTGLAEWNRRREAGEHTNWMEIQKDFNEHKYFALPWLKGIHKDAHSRPFRNLGNAFKKFFDKLAAYPKFHKKRDGDSFYVCNDRMDVKGFKVRLPKVGWIKTTEKLRFDGKIVGATVFRKAQTWSISILVEVGDIKKDRKSDNFVGVDAGINSAMTLSTGEKIDAPKPLKKALRKLNRLERKKSRQKKGGENRKKTIKRLGMAHAKVANIRRDFWHKQTTRLCSENQAIAIEKLNVNGMRQNRKLARAISDVAFGELKQKIWRKFMMFRNSVVVVSQWFPSSKTCSRCKHVKEKLELSERTFHCEKCGLVIDRDVNAAINLKNQIPEAFGKSMSVNWKQGMAPCEAETSKLVGQQAYTVYA